MNWVARQQLVYLGAAVLILLIIIIGAYLYFKPAPSCFDGKQNQDEEGVDCGGVCTSCIGKVSEPIILWTKVFSVKNEKYEAASLIKNPNFLAGVSSFKYKFKLYDASNILISIVEGETFLNPGEKTLIFETGIDAGERIPKRAFIEFEEPKWKHIEREKAALSISEKRFNNTPFPFLSAKINSSSLFETRNIEAAALLFDENGNVFAVSVTKIENILPESSRSIFFTWQRPFEKAPSKTEILLRNNLTD